MKRLELALLGGALSLALPVPALAQHQGHAMPGMTMPAPAVKKPAAKKATTKKASTNRASTRKAAAKTAGSKTGAAKKAAASKGSARTPAAAQAGKAAGGSAKPAADPHAGHDMATMPTGEAMPDMPSHDMAATPTGGIPRMEAPSGTGLPAGNAPPPPVPADHAADPVYGAEAMAMGRHHLQAFHGGQKLFQILNNVMEYQAREGRDGYEWDSQAWYGGDIGRLWLKSEGEGASGVLERAEVQALYSHAIDPYFNLQGGLRYDFKPNPSRVYATVGVEGLAPSFFDLEGALFLSNKGELLARAEGYYDQRITQRLILQPRVELDFAAQNSRATGVGAGLSDAEAGVRLRYDIRREFSPYIGIQYQRAFGATRRYLREAGENSGGWELVAGIRTWL